MEKALNRWCRENFINYRSLRHARDVHRLVSSFCSICFTVLVQKHLQVQGVKMSQAKHWQRGIKISIVFCVCVHTPIHPIFKTQPVNFQTSEKIFFRSWTLLTQFWWKNLTIYEVPKKKQITYHFFLTKNDKLDHMRPVQKVHVFPQKAYGQFCHYFFVNIRGRLAELLQLRFQ